MNKKAIQRNKSIVTTKELADSELELLHCITQMPARCSTGEIDTSCKEDVFYDLNIYVDINSGMLQVNPLVPLELLYSIQHNDSIGSTWRCHHQEFSKFISALQPENILEFGAGAGALSKIYLKKNNECKWTIIEMNPTLLQDRTDVVVIQKTIDKNTKIDLKYDTLVHSHFLEHVYDPAKFIRTLSEQSAKGTKHAFSIPNFDYWLRNKHANTLFFEHTVYLDERFMKIILENNGFKVQMIKYYENHSVFYSCENIKEYMEYDLPSRYEETKTLYLRYVNYIDNFVNHINEKIGLNDKIYLFGAHIFSQILLCSGLKKENIHAILDNSDIKIGKRLYGFDYKILNPNIIADEKKPIVILNAGSYQNEIKSQLIKINKNVVILEST